MFGLPKDTNFDYLIGAELQQVSFGRFQLLLRFSNKIEISVEGEACLKTEEKNLCVWKPDTRGSFDILIELIGSKIIQYEILENGVLQIFFDNSMSLFLYDSNDEFESYQIMHNDQIVII